MSRLSPTPLAKAPGTCGVPWAEARSAAWNSSRPLATVTVALAAAVGRTAACDLPAPVAMPAVATAAMDGYAVAGSGPWQLVGTVLAGDGMPPPLDRGSCAGIATGAPVPSGTDAVLPVEKTVRVGDLVDGTVTARRHIRTCGEDAVAGDLLVGCGARLGPAAVGLLAAAGYDRLPVRARPRASILLTGDEIRTAGRPGDGFVRDAIGPMLPGLLEHWGAEVAGVRLVPDRPGHALAEALDDDGADLLLVCGATSAGPTDRLRALLADCGAHLVVDSVACRPGHPQLLAVRPDGRPVVGLPGNPFAALAAALTLVWPAVDALVGRPLPALPALPLAEPVPSDPARTCLVPVRVRGSAAQPLPRSAPGSLRAAAHADAVAVLEPARAATGPVPLLPLP